MGFLLPHKDRLRLRQISRNRHMGGLVSLVDHQVLIDQVTEVPVHMVHHLPRPLHLWGSSSRVMESIIPMVDSQQDRNRQRMEARRVPHLLLILPTRPNKQLRLGVRPLHLFTLRILPLSRYAMVNLVYKITLEQRRPLPPSTQHIPALSRHPMVGLDLVEHNHWLILAQQRHSHILRLLSNQFDQRLREVVHTILSLLTQIRQLLPLYPLCLRKRQQTSLGPGHKGSGRLLIGGRITTPLTLLLAP